MTRRCGRPLTIAHAVAAADDLLPRTAAERVELRDVSKGIDSKPPPLTTLVASRPVRSGAGTSGCPQPSLGGYHCPRRPYDRGIVAAGRPR